MLCDKCVHAKCVKGKFDCEDKLDPRVPYVMYPNTNCPLYKKVN